MKCLKLALSVIFLALSIFGCSDDDNSTGSSTSYTPLSGNITQNLTLSGSPYSVVGDVVIPASSVVSIDPGVQVLFSGFYSLTVEGKLFAIGTAANNIVFSTTPGNRANQRGNYEGIVFNNPNLISILEYCLVEDGALFISGSEDIRGVIHCDGSSPVIRKCVIADNGYNAVFCKNDASPLIDGCTITNNAFSGVVADTGSSPLVRNCIIVTNDDYGCTATLNSQASPRLEYCNIWDNFTTNIFGIDVTGFPGLMSLDPQFADPLGDYQLLSHSPCIDAGGVNAVIDPDGTRRDMGALYYDQSDPHEIRNALSGTLTSDYSPYLVTSSIWVEEGDTLTIEPGVELRFNATTTLRFSFDIYGVLNAEGTAANPITITSNKIAPDKGDWDYLYFHEGSSAELKNFNARFASQVFVESPVSIEDSYFYGIEYNVLVDGVSPSIDMTVFDNCGDAGLLIQNHAAPSVKHCVFYHNQGYGIYSRDFAAPVIMNSIFLENFTNGLKCESFSTPQIINNTFAGNGYYGIYCYQNADALIVNNIIDNNGKKGVYCALSSFPTIAYNDSYGHSQDTEVTNYSGCPADIGLLSMTNTNGDSCDFNYNFALDPLLSSYTSPLPAGSPCIDAGVYPYPGGSVVDLGAFGGPDGGWNPPVFYEPVINYAAEPFNNK